MSDLLESGGVHRGRMCAVLATACMAALTIQFFSALASAAIANESSSMEESQQIERGRYLVTITGCNDCHTPGYSISGGKVAESKWLTGDRLGYQGPWGTTYPANLRVRMQALSVGEWLQLARRRTRPPMPWFALRDMSDADLIAIYRFIRSLGPAGGAPPSFVPPGQNPRTPVVSFPSSPSAVGDS